MTWTTRLSIALLVGLAGITQAGDDPKQPPQPVKEKAKDFSDFSKLLHRLVVAKAPKMVENRDQWGQTIPIPEKLRLPNAKRTYVKVGDHLELPDGSWRRTRVWLDDPAKDIVIVVRDFKKSDAKNFRLSLDAQAAIHSEGELQRWTKGLLLLNVSAQADALFTMNMEVDVAVSFKTDVFPPALVVEPKVAECKLVIKEFAVKKIANVQIEGPLVTDLNNQMREYLQQLLTLSEPMVKTQINDVITEGLRDGKGPSILELLSATK